MTPRSAVIRSSAYLTAAAAISTLSPASRAWRWGHFEDNVLAVLLGCSVRRVNTDAPSEDENAYPWPINAPLGIQLHGPDFDADVQMLAALGAVVRASADLEFHLRRLYCSLQATKYAVITAAGQSTSWLIDMCRALLRQRNDVTEPLQEELSDLLTRARTATEARNRYVHDVWAGDRDGSLMLMRSPRRSPGLAFQPVTLDELVETAQELTHCAVHISFWVPTALGSDAVHHEAQLRFEQENAVRQADSG